MTSRRRGEHNPPRPRGARRCSASSPGRTEATKSQRMTPTCRKSSASRGGGGGRRSARRRRRRRSGGRRGRRGRKSGGRVPPMRRSGGEWKRQGAGLPEGEAGRSFPAREEGEEGNRLAGAFSPARNARATNAEGTATARPAGTARPNRSTATGRRRRNRATRTGGTRETPRRRPRGRAARARSSTDREQPLSRLESISPIPNREVYYSWAYRVRVRSKIARATLMTSITR